MSLWIGQTMFKGLTAWFSKSVGRTKRQKWVDAGGTEASLDNAQYIFSENAKTPDTQRLFESPAYLDEHLSVFHAKFISECVKKGKMEDVVLGEYLLVPADVQEVCKHVTGIRFLWEVDGNTSDGQSMHSDSEDEISVPHDTANRRTDKPGQSSHQQAGTSRSQSNKSQSLSKTTSVDKQKDNQSVVRSDSENQPKTLGQKTSPKGKHIELKETNQSKIIGPKSNPRGKEFNQPKEKKKIPHGSSEKLDSYADARSPAKHKQIKAGSLVTEKKQKLSADEDVEVVDKAEIWQLENLAKVMDKIEDFSVGLDGYDIYEKAKRK